MPNIILYGFGPSRSARVVWALRELKLDFDMVAPDLRSPEGRAKFAEISPLSKVPTLVWGDEVWLESFAICTNLGDAHPESGLVPPAGTKARREYEQWGQFVVTELDQSLWLAERHTWVYPEEKRIPEAIESAHHEFDKGARVLEHRLRDRNYLAGTSFSMADITLAHVLRWSRNKGLLNDYPRLNSYLEALMEREAFPHDVYQRRK